MQTGGDAQGAIATHIDAVCAIAGRVMAQPRKGRMIDRHRGGWIVGRQDARLAIEEHRVADAERTLLDADTGAIAITHLDMAEDDPLHLRPPSAQHERRLSFARDAGEDRLARLDRDIADPPGALHRAFAIGARRDADHPLAIADRIHRILQRAEAARADHEGLRNPLRQRDAGSQTEKEQRNQTHKAILKKRAGAASCHARWRDATPVIVP